MKTQTAEKNAQELDEKPSAFVISTLIVLLIGIIIAIPVVYSVGRDAGLPVNQVLTNVSNDSLYNECTTSLTDVEPLLNLASNEPFPFRPFNYIYRPIVILKEIYIIFGFNQDIKSWSLDKISILDTTTNEDQLIDGDFESNYLTKNYLRCVLSNTRNSTGDILFDNPYSGQFYYNDETKGGMAYLTQKITIIGGRYYNITFYLENRGYGNNTILFLIGFFRKK